MKGLIGTALLASLACACGGSDPPAVASTPLASSASARPPIEAPGACADDVYTPATAYSGRAPSLPTIPELSTAPRKDGDAFTVFGASHALTSRFESPQVTGHEITIVGWIVDSNLAAAPACTLHPISKKSPDNCDEELPSFSIADAKEPSESKAGPRIRVLGWAKNFATLFDASAIYAKGKPAKPVIDEIWSVDVPYPLPAIGAKVKVIGRYAFSFTKSSTGLVTDPRNGVLTYTKMEVLEPAARPAKLGK